jgi:UDP-glucose 4-epimerase
MAQLLITGGAGFIGSHSCLVLLEAGHNLVVLDNFDNSSPESLKRVLELAGPSAAGRLQLVEGDIRSAADLERAFEAAPAGQPISAVVHFAGLKAVGESVREPLRYWDVNLCGSRQLLEAMQAHGCRSLVFSSSATLYGMPELVPIPESAPIQPINPYGHSKAAVEQLLADLAASEAGWRIARLRYFNPVGAHPSGRIGEDPRGIPNNLFPFVSQVAVGRRDCLQVFGGDWPTPDGSGIRDYIHVMDLAEGHRAALDVGGGEGLRARQWPFCSVHRCGKARRRRGQHRGRSTPGNYTTRLAHPPLPRGDVPRRLGLAAGQSRGLWQLKRGWY